MRPDKPADCLEAPLGVAIIETEAGAEAAAEARFEAMAADCDENVVGNGVDINGDDVATIEAAFGLAIETLADDGVMLFDGVLIFCYKIGLIFFLL